MLLLMLLLMLMSSFDAWGDGGRWGAGQRLRSGAFAPDCPVVIFVSACGASFRFPRAYRLPAPHRPPSPHAPSMEISRQLGRVVCLGYLPTAGCDGRSCRARPRPAARAAFWGLRVVMIGRVWGGLRVVMVGRVWGAVSVRSRCRTRGPSSGWLNIHAPGRRCSVALRRAHSLRSTTRCGARVLCDRGSPRNGA